MSAVLREQWWENGRLHRVWFDADTGKVTHERLIPPERIAAHARALEAARDNRKERARAADGLVLAAQFTPNERDELHRAGVKFGDIEGLEWALKRDKYRHARVLDGKVNR